LKRPNCRLCEKARTTRYHLRLCDGHLKQYLSAQWAERREAVNAARRTGSRRPKPKPQPKPKAITYRYAKPPEPEPVLDIRPTKPVRPVRHIDPEAVRLQNERAAFINARLNSF
jgi:hypothetical protein